MFSHVSESVFNISFLFSYLVDATYFLAVVPLVNGNGPVLNIVSASTRPITASDLGIIDTPAIPGQPAGPTDDPLEEDELPVGLVAGFSVLGFFALIISAAVYGTFNKAKKVVKKPAKRPLHKRSSVRRMLDPFDYYSRHYQQPRVYANDYAIYDQMGLYGSHPQTVFNQGMYPPNVYQDPPYDYGQWWGNLHV